MLAPRAKPVSDVALVLLRVDSTLRNVFKLRRHRLPSQSLGIVTGLLFFLCTRTVPIAPSRRRSVPHGRDYDPLPEDGAGNLHGADMLNQRLSALPHQRIFTPAFRIDLFCCGLSRNAGKTCPGYHGLSLDPPSPFRRLRLIPPPSGRDARGRIRRLPAPRYNECLLRGCPAAAPSRYAMRVRPSPKVS